jgi:acyl-coenzyme A thioesterase 13
MDLKKLIGTTITQSPSMAGNWLQMVLLAIDQGEASIKVLVRDEMTNPYKNIHGGMMALIIDECIGWAVVSLDVETNFTTLNLNVDYLYAIRGGETLIANSKVIRQGKKIINVECIVKDESGRLLAKASSNLINTGMQRPRIEDMTF